MTIFLALLPFSFIAPQTDAAPTLDNCALHMSENDSIVTIQGVVNPNDWSQGSYQMQIEARQGGNQSLSRQAGNFDQSNIRADDGSLVLSTATLYVSDGGSLFVTLTVEDEDRNVSCSFDYER